MLFVQCPVSRITPTTFAIIFSNSPLQKRSKQLHYDKNIQLQKERQETLQKKLEEEHDNHNKRIQEHEKKISLELGQKTEEIKLNHLKKTVEELQKRNDDYLAENLSDETIENIATRHEIEKSLALTLRLQKKSMLYR